MNVLCQIVTEIVKISDHSHHTPCEINNLSDCLNSAQSNMFKNSILLCMYRESGPVSQSYQSIYYNPAWGGSVHVDLVSLILIKYQFFVPQYKDHKLLLINHKERIIFSFYSFLALYTQKQLEKSLMCKLSDVLGIVQLLKAL